MEVYFQGIQGSYSEQAVIKYFGKKVKAKGVDSFEEVFDHVSKKGTYGVVPVENSFTGSITKNYDLLYQEKVTVIAEIYSPINHVLLGNLNTLLKDIITVYSHPQALSQCSDFIRKHNWKTVNEYDTAGAAKLVKERQTKHQAAIASSICADLFGMKILAEGIMNNKNNTTRFLVFVGDQNAPTDLVREKTSIVFKIKHLPGALVRSLESFSKINLTKIESRPDLSTNWEYLFYVDFEGGTNEEKIKEALRKLNKTVSFMKVIGSYPLGKK